MSKKEKNHLYNVQSVLNEILSPMLPLVIKKEFPEGIRPVEVQRWFQSHFKRAALAHREEDLIIRTYVVHEALDLHLDDLKTLKIKDRKYQITADDEKFNSLYRAEARSLYILAATLTEWLEENYPEIKKDENDE